MSKENKEKQLAEENKNLRLRLEELEDTLRAIHSGEVDALVISGPQGEQVYTLKGANQSYRVLVETMNEGTATVAGNGMILYGNNRLAEMLKIPLEKIMGDSVRSHIAVEDLQTFDALLEKGLKVNCKGEVRLKAGSEVLPVQLSLSPVCHIGIDCTVIVITDLTDQKRVEAALRKASEELEMKVQERTAELETANTELQAEIAERKQVEEKLNKLTEDLKRSNAELEQFAYIASHDLQAPLRNIEGFVKMLVRRYQGRLDEKADEFISYISTGVKDMQALILDILEYSKAGIGKKFKQADTSLCIAKALANLRDKIAETNAGIICDNPLPTVSGDFSQLTSLFQNLIENAIKFSKEAPRIHIAVKKGAGEYIFSVQDNGIGIEPEYMDKVFNVFQRLHSRYEYSGTGIGLAICKKIVERHNGRIWVESAPGKGSTFFFTIPSSEPIKAN